MLSLLSRLTALNVSLPSPGFEGRLCESNIDNCLPDPCHHGTCIDGIASYTCNCVPGYTGYRCENQLNECHSNPCQNGGKCVDLVNKYICQCQHGTSGKARTFIPDVFMENTFWFLIGLQTGLKKKWIRYLKLNILCLKIIHHVIVYFVVTCSGHFSRCQQSALISRFNYRRLSCKQYYIIIFAYRHQLWNQLWWLRQQPVWLWHLQGRHKPLRLRVQTWFHWYVFF